MMKNLRRLYRKILKTDVIIEFLVLKIKFSNILLEKNRNFMTASIWVKEL